MAVQPSRQVWSGRDFYETNLGPDPVLRRGRYGCESADPHVSGAFDLYHWTPGDWVSSVLRMLESGKTCYRHVFPDIFCVLKLLFR